MAVIASIQRGWLSVAEAESLTGISRWTWRRWAYDGKVGSTKVGKRLLISREEIERTMSAGYRPALEQR